MEKEESQSGDLFGDYISRIAISKKEEPLNPKWVFIKKYNHYNRYEYKELCDVFNICQIRINSFSSNIVIAGKGWYIKNWELNRNPFTIKADEITQIVESDYEKENIEILFSKKLPDGIYFCDSCGCLITEYELNRIHSCKRCYTPQGFCSMADKKKKTDACNKYSRPREDDGEYCEECLSIQKQMEEHPGSFWGVDDENYDEAFHSWFEN
jgi:hypothetical protein